MIYVPVLFYREHSNSVIRFLACYLKNAENLSNAAFFYKVKHFNIKACVLREKTLYQKPSNMKIVSSLQEGKTTQLVSIAGLL